MTDKDIIKALECCIKLNCEKCDLKTRFKTATNCRNDLLEYCLDLISRQKAEIEMLEIKIEGVQEANAILREHIRKAVKEFAERLKEYAHPNIDQPWDDEIVDATKIDNLVKEMVGDNDAES